MNILIIEYITGGNQTHSAGLTAEGDAMLNALLGDIEVKAGRTITITRNKTLPNLAAKRTDVKVVKIKPTTNQWDRWVSLIAEADIVWGIAPESNRTLERLCRMTQFQGKYWVGCAPEAIKLAGSKLATYQALVAAGIPAVETSLAIAHTLFSKIDIKGEGPYVVKPDDGVGSEGVVRVTGRNEIVQALIGRPSTTVVQPYIKGISGSISILITNGKAAYLGGHQHSVTVADSGEVQMGAISLQALDHLKQPLTKLAEDIAAAVPGLRGYVGVDIMIKADDGAIQVLEINPRLTSSYVGLSKAVGFNIAESIISSF